MLSACIAYNVVFVNDGVGVCLCFGSAWGILGFLVGGQHNWYMFWHSHVLLQLLRALENTKYSLL